MVKLLLFTGDFKGEVYRLSLSFVQFLGWELGEKSTRVVAETNT
uniref:Uncharacterized protein n=1 Tax=Anguilla anguilla TaxID=7936 RepID=A0A0E9PTC9_ANGAN